MESDEVRKDLDSRQMKEIRNRILTPEWNRRLQEEIRSTIDSERLTAEDYRIIVY